MTNPLLSTQGQPIPDLTLLQKIQSPTKLCTIYHQDNTLLVGFGGTRDNLWDWLSNLDPEIEALELLKEIRHWVYIYQPAKIILAGHSQGGAHAEIIAERMIVDCEVFTFGGLPTRCAPDCPVTHYLVRSDPMAWLPIRRKGIVIKMGKLGFSLLGHDPKTYLAELAKLE